jgi:hypothetical protein
MGSEPQAKFVPIDEQPDHNVMPLNRFGEADCLTRQPLNPRTQSEMLALDLLRMALTRLVLIGIDMTGIRTPIVRVIAHDAKRLQQRFELQKDVILATSKDIRQDLATAVINSMPKPPLIFFAHHVT